MTDNHSDQKEKKELAREVGPLMLVVYAAGTILGAGIYVVIGKIAGEAGYWTPLAFLVAALAAGVNGLVYAELATRTPRAGGPTAYVHKAFDARWFAVVIGWMIAATGIVSAATITTGFSGYLGHFFDMSPWTPRAGLVVGLATVAALGAKESMWFMAATTTAGLLGLLFVLYVGFFDGGDEAVASPAQYVDQLPAITDITILTGVLSAAFLAVYSFIGFEDVVHMAEEVRKPAKSIPLAIVVAIFAALFLYVLVSLAALMVVEPKTLAESDAPLIAVVEKAGYPGWPLALLSLWIILNGALAQIIMASRVIYSLGDLDGAPTMLATINKKTETPLRATVLVSVVVLLLAVFLPLKTLATTTSYIILLVFAASNAALIVLERRDAEAPFDTPKFVPWVGLLVCAALVIGKTLIGGGGH